MPTASSVVQERLKNLEQHLERENPILIRAIKSFRELDQVAYDMHLLDADQTYADQIPWWPLIAILGTFSAGKSTFINHYLGQTLQRTGNHAVDERFTVICFSEAGTGQALPGVALDSDPRFPLYHISESIDEVAAGEGKRTDAYIQLRTCASERLRGRIIVDSPGFDADAQRTATLRIVDHIIDLSDLVLVFFDARHPEPGAMRDTLKHLVAETIRRPDSGKFLYILNQIDATAREDNPEDVIAAWQRALGEHGLTAGRFYTIYSPDVAVPIEDINVRRRFETKRDRDLLDIHERMQKVEIERAYRIIGSIEKTAIGIADEAAPLLSEGLRRWRTRVLAIDAVIFGILLAAFMGWSLAAGHWNGLSYEPAWLATVASVENGLQALIIALVAIIAAIHFKVRSLSAKAVLPWLRQRVQADGIRGRVVEAFLANTRPLRSALIAKPRGWHSVNQMRIKQVKLDCDGYVQTLNDQFTNPSGAATRPRIDQPTESVA
ncbi:dynamin family protein [Thioalkalicoccus limnaeus]|uniref:Dynamin family protein n=1 Tax=Thioalkalicoccus limnaeus TaxID=120681 RepID=A0ABV4BF34_9GAMM